MKDEINVRVDCLTAMCIIANIQLACRHSENLGPSRERAEKFARKLQEQVAIIKPVMSTLIELGWNPDNDFDATGYGDQFKSKK